MNSISSILRCQVSRRRTFAIISHPDAGRTPLTEKVLFLGVCVDMAGAVRGRKTQRAATSDWMELEKPRGIPVSSTVLTFEFDVVRFGLASEYNTRTELAWLPFKLARWVSHSTGEQRGLTLPYSAKLVRDQQGHPVALLQSPRDIDYIQRENPSFTFSPMRQVRAQDSGSGQTDREHVA